MLFKGKAAADLAAAIGTYTSNLCDDNWYYEPFTQTYNASDDNVDSYQCDAVIVYTNATRMESAVEATLHILYFVGVRDQYLAPLLVMILIELGVLHCRVSHQEDLQ